MRQWTRIGLLDTCPSDPLPSPLRPLLESFSPPHSAPSYCVKRSVDLGPPSLSLSRSLAPPVSISSHRCSASPVCFSALAPLRLLFFAAAFPVLGPLASPLFCASPRFSALRLVSTRVFSASPCCSRQTLLRFLEPLIFSVSPATSFFSMRCLARIVNLVVRSTSEMSQMEWGHLGNILLMCSQRSLKGRSMLCRYSRKQSAACC